MMRCGGEGAFYGPKLEFVLRDAIGRDWQCGTHQVDLNLPKRLGATYIGEDGQKHTPVLLHRAMFGSLERFIAILLEHHAGNLPLWLAPTQVKVLTITSDADDYALDVVKSRFTQRKDFVQSQRAQRRKSTRVNGSRTA
jgi:threonyl-tRNA synthetase